MARLFRAISGLGNGGDVFLIGGLLRGVVDHGELANSHEYCRGHVAYFCAFAFYVPGVFSREGLVGPVVRWRAFEVVPGSHVVEWGYSDRQWEYLRRVAAFRQDNAARCSSSMGVYRVSG